jgi:hypothetical protein
MRARIWRRVKMRLNRERSERPNLEQWSRSRKWEDSIIVTSDEPFEALFTRENPGSLSPKVNTGQENRGLNPAVASPGREGFPE